MLLKGKYFMRKLLLPLSFAVIFSANANDLIFDSSCNASYAVQVSVNNGSANSSMGNLICSNKSQDFMDYVKHFHQSNPDYTDDSQTTVNGLFNDVPMTLFYAENSTVLVVDAPEIGVYGMTFDGGTRKKSNRLFRDWVKKSGVISEIVKVQDKKSSASTINGISGVIPTTAATDFDLGAFSSNIANTAVNDRGRIEGLVGIMPSFSVMSINGQGDKMKTTTLPLSYTYRFQSNPNQQLIISAPISYYEIGSASGYQGGLGLAYKHPVNDNWSLTPAVRYSMTGSRDRASLATIYTASLTSNYRFDLANDYELNVGNMVGYYETGKFKSGSYSFDPNIQETMLKNGIMLSQPVEIKGSKYAIEYSVIDTRYVGTDKPFMSNMQEYGITFGTHRKNTSESKLSHLRGGLKYTDAKGAHGLTFNFGYWF